MPKELINGIIQKDEIDVDNHIATELLNNFTDDNELNPNYIWIQFEKGNYTILPSSIAVGTVFKIPLEGNLDIDGYEKGLLYLTPRSGIKEHIHENDVEQYTLLEGELRINNEQANIVNRCLLKESHMIDPVSRPTVIKTLKVSKMLIEQNKPSYKQKEKNKDNDINKM